jgi:hypothetical protein
MESWNREIVFMNCIYEVYDFVSVFMKCSKSKRFDTVFEME